MGTGNTAIHGNFSVLLCVFRVSVFQKKIETETLLNKRVCS